MPAEAAFVLPLAHLGHWLWIFYVIPILIVVGGIVYSTRVSRREEAEGDEAAPPGPPDGPER